MTGERLRNRNLGDPLDGIPREPTAWLRRAVRRRLAALEPSLRPLTSQGTAVFVHLTDAPAHVGHPARSRWEFSCDRCRRDCRPDRVFVNTVHPVDHGRAQVVLGIGLCERCGIAERGREFVWRHGLWAEGRRPEAPTDAP